MLSFFQNFEKTVQNEKKLCLPRSIFQEPYESFMVQMCKMIIYPGVFFFFNVRILSFQVVKGLKGQKMTKNDKSYCLSHLTFQDHVLYDLHLWHTCMYKRISFFSFVFQGKGRGAVIKEQKLAQNDKNFFLSHSVSQEPYII